MRALILHQTINQNEMMRMDFLLASRMVVKPKNEVVWFFRLPSWDWRVDFGHWGRTMEDRYCWHQRVLAHHEGRGWKMFFFPCE